MKGNRSVMVAMAACIVLGAAVVVHADPASDAFNQWKAQLEEVQKRVGNNGSGPLKNALSEAERSRFQLQALAGSLKERDGEIESGKFTAKVYKDDWESAQRDAKRVSDARDAKAKELQAEFDRLDVELKRLNAWDDRLGTWDKTIVAWRGRLPPKVVPPEQFAAAQAEVDRFNAEVDRYNADLNNLNADKTKYRTWADQLKAIEQFVVEQGRASLQAQAVASKKERDYWEKQDKVTKLEKEQDTEMEKFSALMGPANAAVQAVLAFLNEPAPVAGSFTVNAAPYSPRTSEAAAQATRVASVPETTSANRVQDRIFVLAPENTLSDPAAAQAELARRRLRAEMAAAAIAGQYADVPAGKPLTVAKAPDSISMVRAPEGFVGPAMPGDTDVGVAGDGTLVVTDEMLYRAVNPGVMISDAEYADALKTRERLASLVPKLKLELVKLRGLRKGTLEYEEEFENIRAEAVRGAVRDSIGLVGTQITRLSEDAHYAGTLTPEVLERLGMAVNAVKAGVSYEHSQLTAEAKEKRNQQLETIDSAAETLLSLSTAGLVKDSGERLMLEQMGKMLQTYNKTSRYLNDPQTGNRPSSEEYGEMAKLGIGVAAVFATPVAIGVGVESLGERGLQRVIIQDALVSLSGSLKKSYDADRFLTEKIERLEGFQTEVDRTVTEYESASAGRRAAMHIGGQL